MSMVKRPIKFGVHRKALTKTGGVLITPGIDIAA